MKKFLLILTLVLALGKASEAYAQKFTLSGVVLNKSTNKPIDMATILLPQSELWAVADAQGKFTIKNVPKGSTKLTVSCLGFVTKQFDLTIRQDSVNMRLILDEDNLAIEGVVVTAQENLNSVSTSRMIDRTTMEHMQMINVSDIAGTLPGGVTVNPNLIEANNSKFSIRNQGRGTAAASFGTEIEVDGVRISNNADFGSMTGAETRSLASANVESIEVITGVPSVEYGDISTGVVKVNTKKGRTPYTLSMTINPFAKQFALSKGFDLGASRGAINFSLERAQAFSKLASPYEAYNRNTATINYSNTFNQGADRKPLRLSVGLSGNLGGYNNESDPDKFVNNNLKANDYKKNRDNNIRANVSLNWLLNQSWITSLEFTGSASYTDRLQEESVFQTKATGLTGVHGTEEGYFLATDYDLDPNAPVTLSRDTNWNELKFIDSKQINYSAHIKANWVRRWGGVDSKFKLGVHYTGNGNEGRGVYFDNPKYATEGWRPYEYRNEPYMHNVAVYAEESLTLPIGSTSLNLVAGIRNDNTLLKGSDYGGVSSFSPRFNAKYTIFDSRGRQNKGLRALSIRGGYGKMVKLPSFSILFPTPTYKDTNAFSSPAGADNIALMAYYIQPTMMGYNPGLVWQHTNQAEVGMDFNLYGVKVSLSAYINTTKNPYLIQAQHRPYSYRHTQIKDLENPDKEATPIPVGNRFYNIDRQTGTVTVSDKTGALPSYKATFTDRNTFLKTSTPSNGSSYKQMGLEWVVDFGQIRAIRTDIRVDGAFTYYKGSEQTLTGKSESGNDADGSPYKYLGWYVGPDAVSNGSLNKQLRANLTLTTHIPKIRTIISLRIESSLYRYEKRLSEWGEGTRSYAAGSNAQNAQPLFDRDIYAERNYVLTYPAYYSEWGTPDNKIPFLDAYMAAKENNPALYAELTKMVRVSSNNYFFYPQRISAYCAVNLSVTKEIGKIASISFYANNCFNNMGRVYVSDSQTYDKLYESRFISNFYYGASLRLKF